METREPPLTIGVLGFGGSFMASLPKSARDTWSAANRDMALEKMAYWEDFAKRWRPKENIKPDGFMGMVHDNARNVFYTVSGMPLSIISNVGGAAVGGLLAGPAGAAAGGFIGNVASSYL